MSEENETVEAGSPSRMVERTITVNVWLCSKPGHNHKTEKAANACIARSPTGMPRHPYDPVKSWERKRDISRDMLSGMKTKDVALKHDLSKGRISQILKQVIRMTYRNYSDRDALPATDYLTFKIPDNSLTSAKENASHWLAAIDEENSRRTTKEPQR